MRSLPIMARVSGGLPVVFDATHSVSLAATWAMSQGARNCPFLTLTARPVAAAASSRSLLTERGASFGYNTLVSDMRSLPIMARVSGGLPVVLAATWAMSQGARNCPFLTLTARPVAAAASSRSVWRHR
jgi:3-deoxy-D-manno-octulosonic acid (KDO) 8-phosphate synthase